ncbi:hypothetical protein L7F22_013668 [Adiantum nelumboides]|nr:hypothetical protein [Adiantum nelumboides]
MYLRHRRFLPEEHYLRNRRQAIHFNGKVKEGRCPIPNTPKDLYLKWTVGPAIDPESEIISGDDDDAAKVRARGKRSLAQIPSIWYNLEYWKDLKICHLLDPMHIFKNVGHSLWEHLVGLKDTTAARNDLKDQNSKPNLWPLSDETRRETTYEPVPWVLTAEEVQTINKRSQLIRTPTGYGASCRNMFTLDDKSLSSLKTHNWHNFLKHVLPLVIDGCTTQGVRNVIYRLGSLARWITSREIDKGLIPQKKRECIELFCLMEKELPTSFFDIQVHLLIHLVDEIELAGVVSARWMFWVERFMGVLKGMYVKKQDQRVLWRKDGCLKNACITFVNILREPISKLHAYGQMNLLLPCQTRYYLVKESLFD